MIKMQNVKKSFENTEVLKDISLNISEGEIYGLIGHSGAGKYCGGSGTCDFPHR